MEGIGWQREKRAPFAAGVSGRFGGAGAESTRNRQKLQRGTSFISDWLFCCSEPRKSVIKLGSLSPGLSTFQGLDWPPFAYIYTRGLIDYHRAIRGVFWTPGLHASLPRPRGSEPLLTFSTGSIVLGRKTKNSCEPPMTQPAAISMWLHPQEVASNFALVGISFDGKKEPTSKFYPRTEI